LPAEAVSQIDKARWWIKVGLFARVTYLVSALFVIGSTCFATASAAGLMPQLFGNFADSTFVINLVFFVGSLFFTLAAYLQFLGAVNADRISAIAHRNPPPGRFKWFDWNPNRIGWMAAFSQFIGTLLFNLNTFDALLSDLDWLQEDLLIWTPDAIGSICFLAASALALIEYGHGRWVWQPHDISWWIVNINISGSIAFGVSAIYAIVLPSTAELLDAWLVNAWTLLGAICFLVGAYFLLPELGRNLRLVVQQSPNQ
jgi:hypothetical protein